MAFLRIDRLAVSNIRCFEAMDIRFKKGTNVITGENGAGKSTILTSIGFGLYGVKYLANSGIEQVDLITTGKTEGQIDLHFTTDQGEYLSTYKLSNSKGSSWRIRDKRKKINLSTTITETRNIIQQIIGNEIDANAFKNALCSVQGELTILLDATPSERKHQLNKILGLEEFDTTYKHMRGFGNGIKDEKEKISEQLKILHTNYEDPEPLEAKLKENILKVANNKQIIKIKNEELTKVKEEIVKLSNKKEILIQKKQDIKNKNLEDNQNKKELASVQKLIKESLMKLDLEIKSEEEAKTINLEFQNNSNRNSKRLNDYNQIKIKYSENQKIIEDEGNQKEKFESQLISLEEKLVSHFGELNLEGAVELKSDLEQKINLFEHELTSLNKDIKSNQDEVKKTSKLYEQIETNVQSFYEEVKTKLKTKFEDLESLKENASDKLDKLQHEMEDNKIKSDDTIKSLGELISLIDISTKTLDLLNNVVDDSSCPTCFQNFKSANIPELISIHKDKHTNYYNKKYELEKIKNSVKKVIAELDTTLEYTKNEIITINKYQDKFPEIELDKIKLKEIKTSLDAQKNYLSALEDKFEKYAPSHKNKLLKDLDHIMNDIKVYQEMIDSKKVLEVKIQESRQRMASSLNIIQSINLKVIKDEENTLNLKQEIKNKQISLLTNDLIPNFRSQSDYLKREIDYEDDLKLLNISFKKLNSEFDSKDFDTLNSKNDEIIGVINRGSKEIQSLENDSIPVLKERISKGNKNKTKIDGLTSNLNDIQLALPHLGRINEILAVLPQKLMSQITSAVSSHVTQTMRRLIPGRGFENVIFDESGDIKLIHQGNQIDKKTLSGGEKTVLGVALRLALAQYVAPINFMILDEPTNHLDQLRVNEFIEIVDRDDLLGDKNGQLIIVTHREEFNRNANRTIRISVNNDLGRSLIVDENET